MRLFNDGFVFQGGLLNAGYEIDSALSEDVYSTGMSSRNSRNSQFEYVDNESTTAF